MQYEGTEERRCQQEGCEALFITSKRSTRKFCADHTSGAGKSARARKAAEVQARDHVSSSTDEDQIQRRLDRALEENRQLRQALSQARREDIKSEEIREKCYEIAGTSPNPPAWLEVQSSEESFHGVPSTTWSDWHFGEVVNPEEVGYVNEFNTPIAQARVRRLVNTLDSLCFEHLAHPGYPGIVVNLAGDLITGDIHEELQDTNDRYVFQSLLDVQDAIAGGIERLADRFGKVFVPCVPGNHGRDTKKPRMKGRAFTSFEWHLYCQLERYFRNDPRIQFLISNEADAQYRVYNHRYHLTHGDALGVKGGDGIIGALGPIMRGAIKVGRSEAQIGRDFDVIVMGHWHQLISLKGIEVNGSLKGYDEYARLGLRASYEPPQQALWFTHPKYRATLKWPVILEDGAVGAADWVSWKTA